MLFSKFTFENNTIYSRVKCHGKRIDFIMPRPSQIVEKPIFAARTVAGGSTDLNLHHAIDPEIEAAWRKEFGGGGSNRIGEERVCLRRK